MMVRFSMGITLTSILGMQIDLLHKLKRPLAGPAHTGLGLAAAHLRDHLPAAPAPEFTFESEFFHI